ncbi:MAG: DMT family transporter, partial [Alistipes sp.]|nr:DMT family transporter [Alistipes sp.]
EIFLIRFLMAYICLLPFAKGKLWADSWQDELRFAGVGITGGSLYFLAENMALEYAPASNVSLIVCSAPVWTALLLALLYRNERMNGRQIWGSVVAFLGMVLVVLNGRFVLQIAPKGDLLAFAAAWLWVLYSLIIKQIGHRYKALFITRKTFFYGLLTILPWFLYEPFEVNWTTLLHPLVAGNLLFLGVVASMLCYLVWAVAMRELGAVRATNYIYLNPLITILTAAICIADRITPIALLGAGLILYGMWRAERN